MYGHDPGARGICSLSLHDALPIYDEIRPQRLLAGLDLRLLGEVAVLHHARQLDQATQRELAPAAAHFGAPQRGRSEEHTSELQSQSNLVCRLLLEKKKVTGQGRSR